MKKTEAMNPKLSYIVPVYNTGHFLTECMDSILSQKLDSFEVILVDDGSTDLSGEMCDQYQIEHDCIRVIHKKNGGISSARNAGLLEAKGDYVFFVDSDDFLRINFAEEFLSICKEKDLDIIRGWYGIYQHEEKKYCNHPFPDITYRNKVLTGEQFLLHSVREHANEVVPWLGFFKREYLLKNNLFFPEGIAYEEDQLFFLKALLCDRECRAYQSDKEFYAYRKRAGSATKTPTLKQIKDIVYVVEQETSFVESCTLTKTIREVALRYICSSFYQLTSIYGRLSRDDAKVSVKLVPFWMKIQCIAHPYDRRQQIKITLFTFARWIVDLIYNIRGAHK